MATRPPALCSRRAGLYCPLLQTKKLRPTRHLEELTGQDRVWREARSCAVPRSQLLPLRGGREPRLTPISHMTSRKLLNLSEFLLMNSIHLLGRKAMTNLDSILKSRDIALPTKVCLVKAVDFPVVTYGCESWTIKKAEC